MYTPPGIRDAESIIVEILAELVMGQKNQEIGLQKIKADILGFT